VDRLNINGFVDLGAFTLTLNVAGGSIVQQNGVVSNTGGVTSSGSGIVFITSACTYTGPTNITAGSFVLAGSSLSPSSVVTVTGGLLQFANGASAGPVNASSGTTVTCQVAVRARSAASRTSPCSRARPC
jgi:autotransporter-associated beta strand protein